jgi:antitoxin (DNA-binding transcriptional repressor) of toxin-antitoxin stability system
MPTIAEAKAHFADLIRRAEAGERISLTRHGRPVAEIGPPSVAGDLPLIGAMKGRLRIADDFDDLPEGFAEAFGP